MHIRQPRSYTRPVEVGVPYALVLLALAAIDIEITGFHSTRHLNSMSSTSS
jgi:hypothetical protein